MLLERRVEGDGRMDGWMKNERLKRSAERSQYRVCGRQKEDELL